MDNCPVEFYIAVDVHTWILSTILLHAGSKARHRPPCNPNATQCGLHVTHWFEPGPLRTLVASFVRRLRCHAGTATDPRSSRSAARRSFAHVGTATDSAVPAAGVADRRLFYLNNKMLATCLEHVYNQYSIDNACVLRSRMPDTKQAPIEPKFKSMLAGSGWHQWIGAIGTSKNIYIWRDASP